MQPLKSLTFVRIGDANSHKYIPSKKTKRHLKTLIGRIDKGWEELNISISIATWFNNSYAASNEEEEDIIYDWIILNRDLYNECKNLYRYIKFNSNSYHSPPQTRGLYAFPQYRLETFLTHWDDSKFHIKVKKDGTLCRMRAKKYITINYNKPTLWCHFIDEAKELGVDIRVSKYWVLVNSCDYLKVLALWEKRRTKQIRKKVGKNNIKVKHCYPYTSKDDLEVFLVGV